MKLSTAFAVLASVAIAVTATLNAGDAVADARDLATNGERMARNLPIKPPARRRAATPAYGARLGKRSPTPSKCPTGRSLECCEGLAPSSNRPNAPTIPIGLNCTHTPEKRCTEKLLCCERLFKDGTVKLGIECSELNQSP